MQPTGSASSSSRSGLKAKSSPLFHPSRKVCDDYEAVDPTVGHDEGRRRDPVGCGACVEEAGFASVGFDGGVGLHGAEGHPLMTTKAIEESNADCYTKAGNWRLEAERLAEIGKPELAARYARVSVQWLSRVIR